MMKKVGGGGVMEVDGIRFVIKLKKVHVFVELEHPPYTSFDFTSTDIRSSGSKNDVKSLLLELCLGWESSGTSRE